MQSRVLTPPAQQRIEVAIRFSFEFERLLAKKQLSSSRSLVTDLELALVSGLKQLSELEDVEDLSDEFKDLVALANSYIQLANGDMLPQWKLPFDENLIDEVDLVLLMHGDELKKHGLIEVNRGSVILLVALAAIK